MKKLALFLIIVFEFFVYSRQDGILSNIFNLLESGKFEIVENLIDKVNEISTKNYYNALYYLYLGDYKTAEEYILKVPFESLITDEQKFFYEYIPSLNKIFSNGYISFESKHFKVMLKGRDIILKDYILEKLENIYHVYKEIFKYTPQEKIRVEVYNEKNEFAFASTLSIENIEKASVTGICKFNRIMILSPENLPLGYRWCDTLAHEYIHFLLNRITEFTYPLYLHEGTARYFDTIYRSKNSLYLTPAGANLLIEAKKNDKLIDFRNLKGSFVYLDSKEQVELAFLEVASFIEFLIDTYGEENLIKFIHFYKSYSKNDNNLYLDIFKEDFKSILSKWYEFIDIKKEIAENYPGAKTDFDIFNAKNEDVLLGLNAKQYIELGDRFLLNKNYKAALYQYRKAQQIENFNPIILTRMAKVNFLLKNYKEAENILKKCIEANPNYVRSYELLLKIYYESCEYEKIFDIYDEILEINPFNYEIRKIIAELYSDLGKINEAIKEYEIISVLNPTDEETKLILNSLKKYLGIKNTLKKNNRE